MIRNHQHRHGVKLPIHIAVQHNILLSNAVAYPPSPLKKNPVKNNITQILNETFVNVMYFTILYNHI